MPPRLVSGAILVFWGVAAVALVSRDLLPNLFLGDPPDLRTVVQSDENQDGPTRWTILVADDPAALQELRTVGMVTTESKREADGWVLITGDAWLDSADLLQGLRFAPEENVRLEVLSRCRVDPSGNLHSFHVGLRPQGDRTDLLSLEGQVDDQTLEVRIRSVAALLNLTQRFPYQSRGLVQNSLAPLERMPGLRIGQRWESRVINPLTGRVDTARVEVTGRREIYWGTNLVSALEVVQSLGGFRARTWVRPDGLVLRQEVPLTFVRLVLEREPE